MSELAFSRDLALPLAIVTSKSAFLGTSGSGKSYGAGRLVESILDAGAQVLVVDTVGIWAGLRLSADGKKAGISIPVLGGEHGDMPLLVGHGALSAQMAVSTRSSLVLDVSYFTNREKGEFVTAFAEELLRLKTRSKSPVLVVWEECQDIVPEGGSKQSAHEAVVRLIKIGRNYGVGTLLISQRTAAVSKEALDLSDNLFVFRMDGPRDIAAMKARLTPVGGKEIPLAGLPELPNGTCIVRSPSFLKVFQVVDVSRKRTFDSGATPDFASSVALTKGAPIDLAKFREQLKGAMADAEQNDPVLLRSRIAELQAQLKAKPTPVVVDDAEAMELRGELRLMQEAITGYSRLVDRTVEQIETALNDLRHSPKPESSSWKPCRLGKLEVIERAPATKPSLAAPCPHPARNGDHELYADGPRNRQYCRACGAEGALSAPSTVAPSRRAPQTVKVAPVAGGPGRCARALLTALAQLGTLTLTEAAIAAGYSPSAGGTSNAAGELRTLGLATGSNTEGLSATEDGRALIGDVPPIPTGEQLVEFWNSKLSKCERALLEQVLVSWPEPISLKAAAEIAGYSPTAGGTSNAAGRLRTLRLVNGSNAGMTANERLT